MKTAFNLELSAPLFLFQSRRRPPISFTLNLYSPSFTLKLNTNFLNAAKMSLSVQGNGCVYLVNFYTIHFGNTSWNRKRGGNPEVGHCAKVLLHFI